MVEELKTDVEMQSKAVDLRQKGENPVIMNLKAHTFNWDF